MEDFLFIKKRIHGRKSLINKAATSFGKNILIT